MTTPWERLLRESLRSEALWDEGTEAARNACVAGAPLAAAAITAAAYYDNPLTGSRAMLSAYARLGSLELLLPVWSAALAPTTEIETAQPDYVPGFGFVDEAAALCIVGAGQQLASLMGGPRLGFVMEHRRALYAIAGPLNQAGLCALVFLDAGVSAEEAERRFLLLRLEPALEAAQRAKRAGLAHFPFFQDQYAYEGVWPAQAAREQDGETELVRLKREVGLVD